MNMTDEFYFSTLKTQNTPHFFVRAARTVYSAGDEGVMGLMQPSPF